MSECRVRTTDPLVVAVRAYRGPARGVGEAFDRVMSWAEVYHLEQWGPLIGVYHDPGFEEPGGQGAAGGRSAELPADVRAEAWLPLPPGTRAPTEADREIEVRVLEPERVASCVHRGYPDGVGESLAGLLLWVHERGLVRASATHRQVYLQAPRGRPGDWEIEVQVPVGSEQAECEPPGPPRS